MQILTAPHPFLRHRAKEILAWDKKTQKELEQMVDLLKHTTDPKGVGLAATQVGLDKRLFVLLDEANTASVYANPVIVSHSKKMLSSVYQKKKDRFLEGCLSLPKIWGFVDRPFSLKLTYQKPVLRGGQWSLSSVTAEFSDIKAAYIQHELDHLNGVLFTDHVLTQKGTLFQETDQGLTPISF